MKTYWKVSYQGFLQHIERYFYEETRAKQYARQVGKEREAIITQETGDYYPLTCI